jgi:hypothetical protein
MCGMGADWPRDYNAHLEQYSGSGVVPDNQDDQFIPGFHDRPAAIRQAPDYLQQHDECRAGFDAILYLGREPIKICRWTARRSPLCTDSDRIAALPRNDAKGQDRTHASQQKVDGDLIMMRDYEPQSDAATRRMLASASSIAAALSFGCVFVGTIVSALLSRLS